MHCFHLSLHAQPCSSVTDCIVNQTQTDVNGPLTLNDTKIVLWNKQNNSCLGHKTHYKSSLELLTDLQSSNSRKSSDNNLLTKWILSVLEWSSSALVEDFQQTLGWNPTFLSFLVPNLYMHIYILRAGTCSLDWFTISLFGRTFDMNT